MVVSTISPQKIFFVAGFRRGTMEVWAELKSMCEINDVTLDVQYDTGSIESAYYAASRTMFLKDGVFVH